MKIFLCIFGCAIFWAPLANARLTDHFVNWLENNGYGDYNFPRDDVGGLSFGGKFDDGDVIVNQPIVFVHGNTGSSHSFTENSQYFRDNGNYKDSELYATTWGIPDYGTFWTNYHKKEFLIHIRKFIEAVLNYTSAEKIDVMGHSMGVTMSRTALKGGELWDNGTYDLGPALTPFIDTYIGVAGLNLGSNECSTIEQPVCNPRTGYYPGLMVGTDVVNRSEILEHLNRDPGFEAEYRYSIFSTADEVLKNGDLVYCQFTSHVPGSLEDFVFHNESYTHHGVLAQTGDLQLNLLRNHTTFIIVVKYHQKLSLATKLC